MNTGLNTRSHGLDRFGDPCRIAFFAEQIAITESEIESFGVSPIRRDSNYSAASRPLQRRHAHSAASWNEINKLEQRRYGRLAADHSHEHYFFASVAQQVASGGRVSQKQAATLSKIAAERGWKVP